MNPENNNPQNNGAPAQPVASESKGTLMGVLAYIGILVLIPLFVSKDKPFVKFHVKQGLVLFGISVIVMVLNTSLSSPLGGILGLVNLVVFVLSIIGIVHVVKGSEKPVPLVGGLSKYFDSWVK